MKYYIFLLIASFTLVLSSERAEAVSQQPGASNGCSQCHVCRTPTADDPCLRICPRPRVTPQDLKMGPDEVLINELENEYEAVRFSHRLHAEMTAMDRGCQDCHHFQQVGGITACKDCHPPHIADENLEQPGLKGAYHRQCLGCHQDWSHDTSCEICHLKKGQETATHPLPKRSPGSKFAGLVEPEKKVWHSSYGGGTIVTLFHRNHTEKYGISCASCHHAEGCASCHSKSEQTTTSIRHSEEALHGICNSCHSEMSCNQCHMKTEAVEFSHDRTGWPLKFYHERLSCRRCHGNPNHFTKPSRDCNSCHKDWAVGTFKHAHTGYGLNDTHAEISCEECHVGKNFAVKPTCNSCHDNDITYPASQPGGRLR
ncbi:cytochrome c family protein [bacterium]|nr:cytochrome c family protein [bacterium]